MRKVFFQISLILFLAGFAEFAKASDKLSAIERTEKMVGEIVQESYPELKETRIEIKTFSSTSDYFQSRFSFARFVLPLKMRYLIFVNPQVFEKNAPENGIRAILAHEIAHVLYYKNRNRLELLGLLKLSSKKFTTKFERRTDLEAIKRGYGEGLKDYRNWLYRNIPEKDILAKRRLYFSPEEIDAMLLRLKNNPKIIDFWRKKVPLNLQEILRQPLQNPQLQS